jgi:hypothetical protein
MFLHLILVLTHQQSKNTTTTPHPRSVAGASTVSIALSTDGIPRRLGIPFMNAKQQQPSTETKTKDNRGRQAESRSSTDSSNSNMPIDTNTNTANPVLVKPRDLPIADLVRELDDRDIRYAPTATRLT